MTRLVTVQNSFASGELDPRLIGQTGIKAYANGLRKARNVSRLATGGMERRPGFYDLCPLYSKPRLAEFEFSDDQRYVISFYAGRLEVFDLNGVLLQSLTNCPWNAQQIDELTYSQLGDTMLITHIGWPTRKLIRLSGTSFSLELFAFDRSSDNARVYQPYFKFSAGNVTLTPSAITGSITLEASAPLFVSNHVGTRFRIHDVEVEITGVTSGVLATATVHGTLKVKLALDPYKTKAGSAIVEVQHLFHGFSAGSSVTLSGSNMVGAIPGNQLDGTRAITIIDEHHYSVVAGAAATDSEDGGGSNVEVSAAGQPIRAWLEQSFSAVRGYPGASCFHEGRLWLFGTEGQPDGAFGSGALNYFNFDVGTAQDGESVQAQVGSEDISRIRHAVSNKELQLFTPLREMVYISANGEPITPLNQRIKSQSNAGIGNVQPIVFDGATLFVQENGLGVSELTYSNEQGGYMAVPVSTLAGHLIKLPVSAAASPGISARSEQYAYFVNADGTIAVFHSLRSENLAGWVQWEIGGGAIAKSVTTVGAFLFVAVEVRGSYRLYRLASDQIVQLDGAVLHTSGVAKKEWMVDDRFIGRLVCLVSERGFHGMIQIPPTGIVDLEVDVTQLVVGDAFYAELETLPPAPQLASGERVRLIRRIVRTIVELYDARAVTIDGKRLQFRNAGDDWEAGSTGFTGVKEVRHLGFDKAPTVVISQAEPLYFAVLAFSQEVKV